MNKLINIISDMFMLALFPLVPVIGVLIYFFDNEEGYTFLGAMVCSYREWRLALKAKLPL